MKRDTNLILMKAVHKQVVESGGYSNVENIIDYYLPVSSAPKIQELTDYKFDFLAILHFGGNEGIYIHCYIEGVLDESGTKKTLNCGTYKTLHTDLKAMQIMGELAGSLTYYAYKYINHEIERYTPNK